MKHIYSRIELKNTVRECHLRLFWENSPQDSLLKSPEVLDFKQCLKTRTQINPHYLFYDILIQKMNTKTHILRSSFVFSDT